MKKLVFITGLFLLFAAEIGKVYFIMPFPGSQHKNTIALAYFLHQYILYIRLAALIMILIPLWQYWQPLKKWKKITLVGIAVLYAAVFYLFNFRFLAEKMFYQPKTKILVGQAGNKAGMDKLIVGVTIGGQSKAYPVEIIGYHHQVADTIGGTPVLITYCTVCRTGRVFSPVVNGKPEKFRLVGMDHFNAMFEDKTTGSWWQQATGRAITGPLKGYQLTELPSEQMRLSAWLRSNPASLILQPDPEYAGKYEDLKGFDLGIIDSKLEKRDSGSWQFKSWVIGIKKEKEAKAYDWNKLVQQRLINDSITNLPLLIYLEKDNASFHVWDRNVNNNTLHFEIKDSVIFDTGTKSLWNEEGFCVQGPLKGSQLKKVQAYQEFWHSWKNFNPGTLRY